MGMFNTLVLCDGRKKNKNVYDYNYSRFKSYCICCVLLVLLSNVSNFAIRKPIRKMKTSSL